MTSATAVIRRRIVLVPLLAAALIAGFTESASAAPPVIGGLDGDTVAYVENGSPVAIDQGADVTVSVGGTIDGAKLTVSSSGGSSADSLTFDTSGALSLPGGVGVGNDISLSGIVVANFAASGTGQSGGPLSVVLTAAADAATFASLLGQVRFATGGDSPDTTTRTLTTTVDDNTESAFVTSSITVEAVNDTPTIDLPTTISAVEDTSVAVPSITFADVDAGTNDVRLSLQSATGTLTATSGSGVVASGSGTGTVALVGTLAAVDAFVDAGEVTYVPVANASGDVTLTGVLDDLGSTGTDPGLTGTGTTETATDTATIAVAADNDGPAVTAPTTVGATEDTAADITGISVTDIDSGSSNVRLSLALLSAGSLAATSGSGVAVTGSGALIHLDGSVADINSFVAASEVVFTPAADSTTDVTLVASADDLGNTGTGGSMTDSENVTITIAAVNDAPVLTSPSGFTVTEDVASAVAGLSVVDVDASSLTMTLTVPVSSGTLAATAGGGVTVTGSGTRILDLTGSVADLNAFLVSGVTYTTAADAVGSVSVSVVVSDGGGTGSGGAETDSATMATSVTEVNDAPLLTGLATSLAVTEDVATTLSNPSVAISDVDSASGSLKVTLGVGSGTFSASAGSGVAVVGSGTASLELTGLPAALETYLRGTAVSFTTAANATADVTVTVTVDDQGNTGSGGAKTAMGNFTITVTGVNDTPVITAPSGWSVFSGFATALGGFGVADPDAGVGNMTLKYLAPGSVALRATSGSGVTVTGSGSSTLTMNGTRADLVAFVTAANVSVTTTTDSFTLTISANDNGSSGTDPGLTGSGSNEIDSETVTVTVSQSAPPTTAPPTTAPPAPEPPPAPAPPPPPPAPRQLGFSVTPTVQWCANVRQGRKVVRRCVGIRQVCLFFTTGDPSRFCVLQLQPDPRPAPAATRRR